MRPLLEIRLGAFDPGAHATILRDWLRRPHVSRWWGDPRSTPESVRGWPLEDCALIEADGTPVGYLCWRTPPEDELAAAGLADLPRGLVDIDLLIGEPEMLGRGVGPRALDLLLARLRASPLVAVAGVGTAVANDRAVRAFRKAGFRAFREFHDPQSGPCLYLVADLGAGASPLDRAGAHPQGDSALDIPRIFNISESAHRIHNPITPGKLATLGAALRLEPGTRVLDLGSGSGEMLCTWARDHGVVGTGIDLSRLFTEQARHRAEELGVADRVEFVHGDAAGFVAEEKVGVAACLGATWIGGGVAGTVELLARSLRPGGILLIGEPFWRQLPPTDAVARGCLAHSISDFLVLPELLASFGRLGYDVVEMVLADQDGWDRYEAAKWLTLRRWLDAHPDDELAHEVRARLTAEPERYAASTREYLGWGVFALMAR